MKDNGLLEMISKELKLQYISDLKNASSCELYSAISNLNKEKYSIVEWSYALAYILGIDVELKSYDDIDSLLAIK